MRRRADQLTDAVIRERRTIRVEGRLIGDYGLRSGRVLLVQVADDAEVEIQ